MCVFPVQVAYLQCGVVCDLQVCLSRNSTRRDIERVPDDIVSQTYDRMEWPRRPDSHIAKRSAREAPLRQSMADDHTIFVNGSHSLAANSTRIINAIFASFSSIPSPIPDQLSWSREHSNPSPIHELDLSLRSCVSDIMRTYRSRLCKHDTHELSLFLRNLKHDYLKRHREGTGENGPSHRSAAAILEDLRQSFLQQVRNFVADLKLSA